MSKKKTRSKKSNKLTQSQIDRMLKPVELIKTVERDDDMSQFNFPTSTPKAKFENFVPMAVAKSASGINKAVKIPLIGITKNQARFNAHSRDVIFKDKEYTYIQIMFSGSLMAIKFLMHEEENSVKIVKKSQNPNGSYVDSSFSFSPFANYLKDNTDFLNLDIFNYKFRIKWEEGDIYYIDLSEPMEKILKKKQKKV